MNILITGGSGFLGSALTDVILQEGIDSQRCTVTWVSRREHVVKPEKVKLMTYAELAHTEQSFDIIINLAGAGIADQRWTPSRKHLLLQSRLKPTQAVLDYIERAASKPRLLISGSAIGWYGAYTSKESHVLLSESSAPRNEFQHYLCQQWEQLALKASQIIPVAIIRTGIVIAPQGGMVGRLTIPFKLGFGGKLADGRQMLSWISVVDWVEAVRFIIQQNLTKTLPKRQTYNLTAPEPITNAKFTAIMGHWLHRPTLMSMPKVMLKTLMGEMATLLINGQRVTPKVLLKQGFMFRHLHMKDALNQR